MSSVIRVRLRRGSCVLAAMLAALASIGAGTAQAAAPSAPIYFDSFGNAGQINDSQMEIGVTSPTQLNSMTIHLYSGSSDVLDLPLSDFTLQTTFSQYAEQSYVLTDPASALASLPLGTYTATADATDTGGDSVTGQAIEGSFGFISATSITITPLSPSTTYPDEPITFTGQLAAEGPITTTPSGFGGQTVTVTASCGPGGSWTATTAANGSYSVQVPGTPGSCYQASFAGTAGSGSSRSGLAEDGAQLASTQLTASISQATSIEGQAQTLSGTLTYQSGSQWLPAPAGIDISINGGGQPEIDVLTQADGTYSAQLPSLPGTTTWSVTSGDDVNTDPFLEAAQNQASGTVLLRTAIARFTAKLNKDGIVTLRGCLASSAASLGINDYPNVEIQFAPGPKGPWHNLGSVGTGQVSGCAGAAIDADGPAPSNYAYYRVTFGGDSVLAPTTSNAALAWLYATRFASVKASKHTVASGGKFTLSGTLQYYESRWRGYGSQRVRIIFSRNKKAWGSYGWVKTSRKGTFSKAIADRYGTGYWAVLYYGNNTHLVAGSAIVKVTVHGRAAATSGLAPVSCLSSLLPAAKGGLGPAVSLLRPALGSGALRSGPPSPQAGDLLALIFSRL